MSPANTSLEAAQGALLGVACGDAAGGVLEFSGQVSAKGAAAAMKMPGGGTVAALKQYETQELGSLAPLPVHDSNIVTGSVSIRTCV